MVQLNVFTNRDRSKSINLERKYSYTRTLVWWAGGLGDLLTDDHQKLSTISKAVIISAFSISRTGNYSRQQWTFFWYKHSFGPLVFFSLKSFRRLFALRRVLPLHLQRLTIECCWRAAAPFQFLWWFPRRGSVLPVWIAISLWWQQWIIAIMIMKIMIMMMDLFFSVYLRSVQVATFLLLRTTGLRLQRSEQRTWLEDWRSETDACINYCFGCDWPAEPKSEVSIFGPGQSSWLTFFSFFVFLFFSAYFSVWFTSSPKKQLLLELDFGSFSTPTLPC